MTRIDAKALGEIEALVLERKKFEKWIGALGERRSITPNHVFQRVLNDYEERMRTVSADLSGRVGDIEASITDLREKLTALQHEEMTISDERAEAELRAAVGEYAADKWEEVRRVADENIARLSGNRMELGGELSHLESILAVASSRPIAVPAGLSQGVPTTVGQGGGTRAPQSTVVPTKEPAAAAPPKIDLPPMITRQPESPPSVAALLPTPATGFDELAFLSSVVETEISQLAAQPADLQRNRVSGTAPSPQSSRSTIIEHDSPMDLMNAAPSSSSTKMGRSATPMISESIHSSPDGKDLGRMPDEAARGTLDRRLSGSVPAYLKDVAKEATKSLKCQECGTMNYPTEWYCERCGGELAAL